MCKYNDNHKRVQLIWIASNSFIIECILFMILFYSESDKQFFQSSIVTSRINKKKVTTTNGSVYTLVGNMEKMEAMNAGNRLVSYNLYFYLQKRSVYIG